MAEEPETLGPDFEWCRENGLDGSWINLRLRAEQAEDITADAREMHVFREGVAQPVGDGLEDRIAEVLIKHAVDVGKAVEVGLGEAVAGQLPLVDVGGSDCGWASAGCTS